MPHNDFAPVIPPEGTLRVMPSAYIGLGGYAKAVFPRLDAHFQQHYGVRPDCLPMSIFDFDEAQAEVTVDGQGFSTQPYLRALPKKPLLDFARKMRGKHQQTHAFLQRFTPYVDFAHVQAVEAPGLNLFVQSGNLAWRLVWEHHVLPDLTSKLQQLHPAPHAQGQLERQGLVASPRSAIWVIAGGGSTTGPTGLIPMLCELKSLKPPQTNLFAVVFTPAAYRDKTTHHQVKGRAIFRATLTQLLAIYDGHEFDQPYGVNGHRINLHEEPFDQLFLVDGSIMGGRTTLTTDDLAELVALFLYQVAVGPIGERLLGLIGNLNPDAQEAHHAD
ncbi:MAG: hypothetical protein HY320_11430 [Armatimonadetes bacterium]|nr:hypothetical protein [Armatimonadota bacterium]